MISTAEEFVRLRSSESREEYLRAAHEEAPMDVWWDVIARFPEMREWVARNKTVPLDVLRKLAADDDVRVRNVVAGKRKLDRTLFALLARDSQPSVRSSVAGNAKTPNDIVDLLCTDADPVVRNTAMRQRAKKSLAKP